MRQAELFVQANQAFNEYVTQIGERWESRVPTTPEWTVRQLVEHVTSNNVNLVTQLSGEHTAPTETSADGAVAAWTESAQRADDVAGSQTEPSREFDGPMGAMSIGDLLLLQMVDRLVHGWDLARAIGADEAAEPGLAEAAYDFVVPRADEARQAGMFGPEIPVPANADVQTKLLALTGREALAHAPEPEGSNESRADVIHRSS